jgi:hypothetical protein
MLVLLIIILSIDGKRKAASKHMKAEAKSKGIKVHFVNKL